MKSYKKATVFVSCGKVTERYHKSFPKPSKGVFTIAVPLKANASLCSNAFQYYGAIKACKKTCLPHKKKIKKNIILQTNAAKFIICLNCKVFIKSAVNFRNA